MLLWLCEAASPILSTSSFERLVDFYCFAFDAEQTYAFAGADGREAYVTLRIGDACLGIGRADVSDTVTERTALWFQVDDVDDSYVRALEAGATSMSEPVDMPWGERVARVRDPDGLIINLGAEV